MKGIKVLLPDGGGTQALPIARSLYKKKYEVHLFYRQNLTYGSHTRYASRKVQSPSVSDETEYLEFLESYIKKNAIDVIVPMSDPTAELISKHKESLSGICRFLSPDYEIFMTGYDKNLLMQVCKENNYPHPRTIDLASEDISSVPDSFFPAILKPNITTGGRGMKILHSRAELEGIYEENVKQFGACHLQEYIDQGGRQLKVELFLDENQKLINSSVIHKIRFYPVAGGSSCFNVTIQDDPVVELCYQVCKKIGWTGFVDLDLIEDPRDGVAKIMEINPRIPACIGSAVDSGVDYGNLIVDASLGRETESYDYIPGKQLRHLGFDILWFLKSKDRFRARPGWFRFFSRGHAFQDLSIKDPLPFIFGSLGNLKKLSSAEFRSSKKSR